MGEGGLIVEDKVRDNCRGIFDYWSVLQRQPPKGYRGSSCMKDEVGEGGVIVEDKVRDN